MAFTYKARLCEAKLYIELIELASLQHYCSHLWGLADTYNWELLVLSALTLVTPVVQVNHGAVTRRTTSIQRALVAHDALNQLLEELGLNTPESESKLIVAIDLALDAELITAEESKRIQFFNKDANEAKHGIGF